MHKPTAKVSPARRLAFLAIKEIEEEQGYSDRVLSSLLADATLSGADRNLAYEIVKGTVRWKLLLDWIVCSRLKKPAKLESSARTILWMAFYQLRFLQRIPRFAVVDESVELAKEFAGPHLVGLVNGLLRNYLRHPEDVVFPDRQKSFDLALSIEQSHPLWLVQRWIHEFGAEKTEQLCKANNVPADLAIRRNPLKSDADSFAALLTGEGLRWRPSDVPDFHFVERLVPKDSSLFQAGYFTVQDPSAGLVGHLAAPSPAATFLDLCAAPGGKATHLAEKMGGRGRVVAGDLYLVRLQQMRNNCERLGLTNIHLVQSAADAFPVQQADGVLLDAPCSGLGVLRKKPDIRWRRTQESIVELTRLQEKLLARASERVKPGGWLVYSTCTVEYQENEEIIRKFLACHTDFSLVHSAQFVDERYVTSDGFVRTWPDLHGLDGSFAAKLERKKS